MLNLLHPRPWLRAWLALVLVAVVLAAGRPVHAGGIVYVVPGGAGTGDGSSWANAKDLAAALAAANSGDELWVKAGVYKPDTTGLTDPRRATFTLKTGVAVYGGFAGTETTRDARNPTTNVTTLNGDLLGNDTPNTPSTSNDNAYHVVTADSVDATSILDGFTITGGVASDTSGAFFGRTGGGIVSNVADATFRNLIITGNSAEAIGGGMIHYFGSPTLTNVTFSGNIADSGSGMYITGDTPNLTNVSFIGNGSPVATYGGGLVISYGSASLTSVTFKLNEARMGGGLFITNQGRPTLTNVTFNNNQADYGAGLYSDFQCTPTLYNALFIGNFGSNGAGVVSQGSQVNLINATFNGNAASKGGAVYTDNNSSRSTDVPTLTSSILWGDSAPIGSEIYNARGSASVSYSIVQGGYSGTGNLNADPKFISPVDPNTSNTSNANLRLGSGSAAVNVGDPNAAIPRLPTGDLDGNPRIVGGRVDMGAYEFQDTTPPDTSLSTMPTNPSGAGVSFTFAGSDDTTPAASLTFQCSLDNAALTTCASPQAYSGLSDGSHTFQVRAVDAVGNVDPSPSSFTWTVDATPPTVTILTKPANPTNTTLASFTFSGQDNVTPAASLTFQCSLDNAGFTTCPSPQAYSGLSDGSHTFQVRAMDGVGNVGDAASFTWLVDTTTPTMTRNLSADSCTVPGANNWCRGTQTAGFTASDAGSGVVGPCSGASCSFTQSTTTNGSSVTIASGQVCDAVGNCAQGISAGPFKIDSVAPTATIITPANGANYVVGATVLAGYTCADTGGSGVATCSGTVASGSAIDTATPGAKTFSVSVTDNAGNTASVQVSYTVGYTVVYMSPTVGPPSVNNVYPIGMGPWYTMAKWRLTSASGTPISAGLVAAVRYTPMMCGATLPPYSDGYPIAGGSLVTNPRFDTYQGAWIFNWQMPTAKGCYALYAKYSGGQIVPFLYRIN